MRFAYEQLGVAARYFIAPVKGSIGCFDRDLADASSFKTAGNYRNGVASHNVCRFDRRGGTNYAGCRSYIYQRVP